MQITQLLSLQMEAALPAALQMKKISREKKRLSPAKGHVCIWNASTKVKSSKSRVPITAAFPSPFVTTRVWRLGASIAFLPKPKKSLPTSQYLKKYTFFLFSKGLLLSLCSCNNFAECHILAEDFDFGPNPCPDTERYLEASYVCVPRSQNYHEGKTIKKESLLLCFFVADAVARKRKAFSFVWGRME